MRARARPGLLIIIRNVILSTLHTALLATLNTFRGPGLVLMPRHSLQTPDSDLSLLQIVTTEGSLATLQLAPAAAQAHSAATPVSLSLSLSLSAP